MSAAVIDMAGVTRAVGRHGEIWAVKEASFMIHAGEFVAIMGPSGSGKTTLLSLLGLLDRPTSGTYLLQGVDVARLTERQRNVLRGTALGFVFQNSYLVASETVADNVALGLRVRGVAAHDRCHLVSEALDLVGLGETRDRRAGELSGGEKQRVAVARAVVTAPDILLADEPTGALDTTATTRLIDLFKRVNADGTTVVVVTHDPLVAKRADRVLEIGDGILRPTAAP